jgi:uncharacterized membrane protein
MKALLSVVVLSLLVLAGCTKPATSGGPGAAKNNDSTQITQADDSFSLDVPNLQTTIKQGETKVVKISINRGKNFDQDVTLSFDKLPAGVTGDPEPVVLGKGEKEVEVKLTASAEAALGEHMVTVRGKPATGAEAKNEFKIEVKQP